jgi:GTP-binding protein HflX
MPKPPLLTNPAPPRGFLFGVEIRDSRGVFSLEDSLLELERLCHTAGIDVVGKDVQRLHRVDSSTLIGSGKIRELQRWLEKTGANLVVFDEELSPRHLRELEKALGEDFQLIDRTALILDIFSMHARTREGALQVELAQYEYRLPRLTRAWTHLARQAGGASGRGGTGGVGLRGPGETQLEIDRREISKKITRLTRELEQVRQQRSRYRNRRKRSGIPVVALVGYTNSGKSTLLNALTRSDVLVADQLFATLDPTTRRLRLPGGKTVLLTDTVGFIQKLPATLIAAFRATLEEITEADLLLHVVDASHPNAAEQMEAVHATLRSLETPDIPMITVLNKSDLLGLLEFGWQPSALPDSLRISALSGDGLEALRVKLEDVLFRSLVPIRALIPYPEGRLLDILHTEGVVENIVHQNKGIRVIGRIPPGRLGEFRPYLLPVD